MSTAADLEKIFSKLSQATVPQSDYPISAIIQLALREEGGGNWLVKIDDNKIDVEQGQAPEPDLALGMAAADFVDLVKGKIGPMELFISGQITVQGDISLALQFQEIFKNASNARKSD